MAEVLDCAHVEPAKDSCGMTPERYCRVRRFSGENKPPARKTAGLLAVTLLASIALADTQSQTGKAHAGSLQAVKIHSPALEGNKLGDPADQEMLESIAWFGHAYSRATRSVERNLDGRIVCGCVVASEWPAAFCRLMVKTKRRRGGREAEGGGLLI
jgi:hypothetical protein